MAAPPLLTLSDIQLTFGGNPVLDGAGLNVLPGDRIGLVGRNGSGKSTLMKLMAGLVTADDGTRFIPPGTSVAYMEQDPDFAGFATLGDFVAAPLDPAEAYRAQIALEGIGLDGTKEAATASGGERRRAALAQLLALDPDLMLLDEPTNHLDIQMIQWLEETLAATRKAFVLISHDRAFLRRLTQATLWVDRGQVRRLDQGFDAFEAWRDKIYEEEDQARHKMGRLIKAESRWAVEGISGRRKRNMGRVRRLQDLRATRAAEIRRTGAAAFAISAGESSGKRVVEAEAISKSFGDRRIVSDFSIKIQRGDRLALIGPNGAGKTTLLNMLTGALAPDSGTIKLGTNLTRAVFDQTRAALDPDMSLWASLTQDPDLGVSGNSDQVMVRGTPRHVVGYLKDFLFSENQARSPVRALSGGEKARLLLARLMAQPSNFLILDEPTNDLDVETLDLLQELLSDYDGTVILVSHDRDFLDRIATMSVLMDGSGRATAYAGGYSDMLAQGGVLGGNLAMAAPKKRKHAKAETSVTVATPAKPRFSANQARRLRTAADDMARLEGDIVKLETLLADPDFYARDAAKFAKATAALVQRQSALAAAEETWLELEEAREAAQGESH